MSELTAEVRRARCLGTMIRLAECLWDLLREPSTSEVLPFRLDQAVLDASSELGAIMRSKPIEGDLVATARLSEGKSDLDPRLATWWKNLLGSTDETRVWDSVQIQQLFRRARFIGAHIASEDGGLPRTRFRLAAHDIRVPVAAEMFAARINGMRGFGCGTQSVGMLSATESCADAVEAELIAVLK